MDVCLRVEANALLLHYLLFKSSLPLLLLLTYAIKLLKTLLALRVTRELCRGMAIVLHLLHLELLEF